jgi:hypothetical protein
MVEWLLGDELNRSFQQQQLTAAASGNFFQVYVLFKNRNSYRKFFFIEVDRVIMVKLH